jgi:hypothetical protein
MKNAELEERLLASIAQRGIEEPLEGVQFQEVSILLNGFKRYRFARKLQLRRVPYASLGEDEVGAIMNLLRISNNRALSILEQAAFIDELYATDCLSVAEMAKELSRSKSWRWSSHKEANCPWSALPSKRSMCNCFSASTSNPAVGFN